MPEATATDFVRSSRKAALDTFMALDLQGPSSIYDARTGWLTSGVYFQGHIAMAELERMQIEWECGRLITAYCNHVDARNYEAFIALFAEDAEWETQSGGYMRGHDEFRAYLERRSATSLVRHVSTNALVEVIDETHARGQSYITLFRDGDYNGAGTSAQIVPALVAEYHDTYIRKDGRWFFKSRFTKVIFSAKS